jgi:hypothetical protein
MALDPRAPAVRVAHLKDDLLALAELGPEAAARVRTLLAPATLEAIEGGQPTGYLPLALNLEMAEAVFAVAGESGARAWGTASLMASLQGFFKPLLVGLTRLVSPSPALMYKTLPQGWLTTYRNCGELRVVSRGEAAAQLVARDLPPGMCTRSFLSAVCGTLETAFHVSRYTGQVTLEPFTPGGGDAAWSVTWKAR